MVAQSRQEVAPTYLPSLSETRRSKCPRPSTFRILLHLETEGTDYPMTWRRVTEEQNRRNEFVAFKFEMNWKLCLIPVLRGERLQEHLVSGSFFFFFFLFEVAAGALECHFELPETALRISYVCRRH